MIGEPSIICPYHVRLFYAQLETTVPTSQQTAVVGSEVIAAAWDKLF